MNQVWCIEHYEWEDQHPAELDKSKCKLLPLKELCDYYVGLKKIVIGIRIEGGVVDNVKCSVPGAVVVRYDCDEDDNEEMLDAQRVAFKSIPNDTEEVDIDWAAL